MMTIARSKNHIFYSVFPISEESYDDIRERLDAQGMLWKYKMLDDDGSEIIVLGTIALKKEQTEF